MDHGERLIRQLDDRSRRRAFELLSSARDVDNRNRQWHPGIPDWQSAFANASAILGPSQAWLPAFKRYVSHTSPRLVIIPTWQCELRCRYCFIPKQDGRVMTLRTLERSIDMLLASDRDDLILQFFGGEALLEWDLVQHGIRYGDEQAKTFNKTLAYIISSNGWSIDKDKLDWLSQYNVKLELSLDGDEKTQNRCLARTPASQNPQRLLRRPRLLLRRPLPPYASLPPPPTPPHRGHGEPHETYRR